MSARQRVIDYLDAVEHDGPAEGTVLGRVLTPDGGINLYYGDVRLLTQEPDHPRGMCFDAAGQSAVALLWGPAETPNGAIFFDNVRDEAFQTLRLTPLERSLMAQRLRYVAERLLDEPQILLPERTER